MLLKFGKDREMKLTTKLLKKLIKEELTRLTEADNITVDVFFEDDYGEEDEMTIEEALREVAEMGYGSAVENLSDAFDRGILNIEGGGSVAEIDLDDISSIEDVSNNLSDFDENVKAIVLQRIQKAEG